MFAPEKTLEERWAEQWAKEGVTIVEATVTFSNGIKRTLHDKAAEDYHRDVWMAGCGRRVDWTRHKWEQTKISS